MKTKLSFFLAAVFLSISPVLAQWVSLDNNSAPDSKPKVELISDDITGTVIKVDISGFRIKEFEAGGKVYQSIDLGSLGVTSDPGMPDVSYIAKVLAVPNEGTISAEVLQTEKSQIIKDINLPPARKSWIEGEPETPYVEDAGVYASGNLYPRELVKVEDPMIFRDFRIARVSIFPIRYSPARHEIEAVRSITVKIKYGGGIGINPKLTPNKPIAPSFAKLYRGLIFNYKEVLQRDYNGRENGYDVMLCIMPDSFATDFQTYADWNHKTGTFIHVTKFSEIGATGSNPTPIRDYILDTYLNWDVPPTHILLVGDAGVAPVKYITLQGWTFVYDDYFVELTGNDYFPEMMIGRFTNQGALRMRVMINKFIGYEKTPFIDDPDWFRKGLVCANDEYQSQIDTKRSAAREMLQNGNFLSVDSMYNGYPCPGNVTTIVNMINAGLGFLNYRGEGWYSGWATSCFPLSTSNINNLANGQKLTFVTSIGCGVANFDEGTANNFGEAWVEIGDEFAPRGGCAFLGPVSNTHTNYNNAIDRGIYIGMFEEGLDSPGEAMLKGKFFMYQVFGGSDPFVSYHYRIYHVLGDPSLHIWKDTPKNINVNYTNTIIVGPGQVQATVTYAGSGLPVEGAQICISGDNVYTVGSTLPDGTVVIDVNTQNTGELSFTVSGADVIPFEGTIQVQEGALNGWQWIETGYPYTIYDASFPPGQNYIGYAVGCSSPQSGIILKTIDGGLTWSKISDDSLQGLKTVCFTSTDTGYIGGYQNIIMKTTDGGMSWTSMSVDYRISYINTIRFWDANHGLVVLYPVTMLVTSDGGSTWGFAYGIKQTVEDVCLADENTLYMVGGDEMISKSTNGGLMWDHIYSGTPFSKLLGVDFYNADYGIAGGENGKMLVTTDGGVNWTASNAGTTGSMHGVCIFDEGNAFTAGTPEQVYKSTDNGLTWVSDFNGGNTVELYRLLCTDNHTALICGSDGKFLINHDYVIPVELTGFTAAVNGNNIQLSWSTATEINNAGFDILRSSDGNSWSKLGFVQGSGTKSTPTNYLFKDQKLTTGGYFYKLKQVDYNGSFKYSNKVYAFISTPAKFSLEQNYPNPFNPVTTIMFSIPKEVMVNITVFNVVGEKVCELKNEVMKPGYYQVDFDASKIASGVYFYRLQAGDFMITKKMNLLK